jgi:glycosyltransferase involved in cell wall biosynthesis
MSSADLAPATPYDGLRNEQRSDGVGEWGADSAKPSRLHLGTVALIIPTKNEAANIPWVLQQIPVCVDEVILVDGHSTDATVVAARCSRPDIQVVHQEGIGKGDALRAGFLSTAADVIVMIDADCSMSPQEIPHFLHFLGNGFDFVKGSRFIAGGGSQDITRLRRWGNRLLVGLVNALYEVQLTDLCYGFCAFHRRYLSYLELTATGFEVETQLTLSALRAGLRVAEVPSLEMPRRYGRSNLRTFSDGTRVLRAILRGHRRGISGHAIQALRTAMHGTDGGGH